MKIHFAAIIALVLAGCAPMSRLPPVDQKATQVERDKQLELALRENFKRTARLNAVGWRVLSANTDACGEAVQAAYGVISRDADSMPQEYRPIFEKLYGRHPHDVILTVFPDSPAARAGLMPGDLIVAIGNRDTSTADNKKAGRELAMKTRAGEPLQLRIRRAGIDKVVTISPQLTCAYPIDLVTNDSVNAAADGGRILVTSGMMRFAATDDELALVLGHELAHNTQKHVQAQMGNRMIGTLLGIAVSIAIGVDISQLGGDLGGMVYSQDFESEADYVGTYFVAKAGFPVEQAADFWRRMAVEQPQAIAHGSTHPDTASRFTGIEAAAREVAEKRAAGRPLLPEMKQ
ncbi:M48 family metallopeptidase [Sulfurisoma sediminicola]|uniref:PDZ domain-containing protein n=1 Tax=Sulfurisoma sediminicola TaxID=1381557 RepID=A0A497XH87_9PROT|nr:M48 family metallopeptidase [Sulfurisoma sediminicola]RLJ65357.1 PDZ domain-containing protein [Sulfurisoma sediminicola]